MLAGDEAARTPRRSRIASFVAWARALPLYRGRAPRAAGVGRRDGREPGRRRGRAAEVRRAARSPRRRSSGRGRPGHAHAGGGHEALPYQGPRPAHRGHDRGDGARAPSSSRAASPTPPSSVGAGGEHRVHPQGGRRRPLTWSVNVSDQAALAQIVFGKHGLNVKVARWAYEAAKMDRLDTQRTLEGGMKQQFAQTALAKVSISYAKENRAVLRDDLRPGEQEVLGRRRLRRRPRRRRDRSARDASRRSRWRRTATISNKVTLAFLLGSRTDRQRVRSGRRASSRAR